jgi:hypothetical protein
LRANDIAILPQAGILVEGAAAHTEGPHAIISLERMIAISGLRVAQPAPDRYSIALCQK